jgi:hypothetical protein
MAVERTSPACDQGVSRRNHAQERLNDSFAELKNCLLIP